MTKVYAQMMVSLDGYSAGPNAAPGNPLGDRGPELGTWLYPLRSWRERVGFEGGTTEGDDWLSAETFARNGAYVMGRAMFDGGLEPWGPNPPYRAPVWVVTHRPQAPVQREGGTTFHFVDDVVAAIDAARAAAGDADVEVAGGANVVQQALVAGLLDELEVHVVPLFLGGGVRLFDDPRLGGVGLEVTRVVDSPGVTHIRYAVEVTR